MLSGPHGDVNLEDHLSSIQENPLHPVIVLDNLAFELQCRLRVQENVL